MCLLHLALFLRMGIRYGIGSWAPIKNVDDHFKPERRDVTMTRFAFQSLLWLDFVMAAIWGPFECVIILAL